MPDAITIRTCTKADGAALWTLVCDSGRLDLNSSYAYLMTADRFGATTLIATNDNNGKAMGFVMALVAPSKPQTVFVWQIGVHPDARGQGLGLRLLQELARQPACKKVTHLETNVTPSNTASLRLFTAFARSANAPLEKAEGYPRSLFPDNKEEELLLRIGPLCGQ